MPTTRKRSSSSRSTRQPKGPPRDLKTENRGVPRGDWNDAPLQEDDGARGIRSNFDDHFHERGRPAGRQRPAKKP